MLTHPTGRFSGDYISAPRDAGLQIFTRPISPINCISSITWGAGRPHVGLCPIFLGSFCFTRFLISHRISELRRPIAAKLSTVISICVIFLMQVQKLGSSSTKIFYPCYILGRFYTTSDFDREYLRNETRYQKSESHVISNDSLYVCRKRSGEL